MANRTADPTDALRSNLPISPAEKRATVGKILKSNTFSASPRLCDFLQYVAQEAIEGRGEAIRAKSIAHTVYERTTVDEMTSVNVVRVEARRLRRLLQDYYEGEGSTDPVRIHIDKGGYAPRFVPQIAKTSAAVPEELDAAESPFQRWSLTPGLVMAAIAGLAILLAGLYLAGIPAGLNERDSARLKREALMEQSPAVLEAANLVAQARGLIYPIFDTKRQGLTSELFQAAIEIDPNSGGAHAGAAQTLASLALMSIEGGQHDAYLAEASKLLDRALALAPADAWTQSAAGWVAFVARDYDNAMRYSQRALSLAPNDGNVLDFYGVVALFSGETEKAAAAASQKRQRFGLNTRFAFRNILATANFHLGNFDEAVRLLEESNATGGPLSAPGVALLAASYQAVGRSKDGQRMIGLLEASWPEFPVSAVLLRLHRNESEALGIINRLKALGWGG